MNLAFIVDNEGGNYLELRIKDFKKRADTYYFALDNCIEVKDSTIEKEKYVFEIYLSQIIKELQNCRIDELIYLPFDFSDQYIGCAFLSKIDTHNFKFIYGYTLKFTGYSINPSDISTFIISEHDFVPTSETYIVNVEDILFLPFNRC